MGELWDEKVDRDRERRGSESGAPTTPSFEPKERPIGVTRVMTMQLNLIVAEWANDEFVASWIADNLSGRSRDFPELTPYIELDYEVWQ